jgi:hypothetical protein
LIKCVDELFHATKSTQCSIKALLDSISKKNCFQTKYGGQEDKKGRQREQLGREFTLFIMDLKK